MITPDAEVLILLCSHLGLATDAQHAPLKLREWNILARLLHSKRLRPAVFLEWSEGDLQKELSLTANEVKRLTVLLARRGALAIELERLISLGIHPLTRADDQYPQRYRQRLKEYAPPVLFYAGEKALLGQTGIAVVGSRHINKVGKSCAEFIGNACGISGLVLYSGGAKGVDKISMDSALQARGAAVAVLAGDMEKAVRSYQNELRHGDLCLVTPYNPSAGFSVGAAMGRNRLIYCLADYAIVVASDAEKGGTWAGATEALKNGWVPVFVAEYEDMPDGNRLLLQWNESRQTRNQEDKQRPKQMSTPHQLELFQGQEVMQTTDQIDEPRITRKGKMQSKIECLSPQGQRIALPLKYPFPHPPSHLAIWLEKQTASIADVKEDDDESFE